MTPSQSSAKCRKSKLLLGWERIPDLISPSAAFNMAEIRKFIGGKASKTGAIEYALSVARKQLAITVNNSPD